MVEIISESFYPNEETLETVEKWLQYVEPDHGELIVWFNSYASNHKKRIATDLEILRNNLSANSKILEVGSSPLLLTVPLVASDYEVTGLDIAPERFSSTIKKLGLNIIKCDIENESIPVDDNIYDAVIFNEIFEHLRINPIFTMQEVLRVLKPNGLLFLSSPNLKSLQGIENFLLHNRAYSCSASIYSEYKKIETIGHMGHVREYTNTEVIEFLEIIGLQVKKLIYRGTYRGKLPSPFASVLLNLFPNLRPFITYVACKDTPFLDQVSENHTL
jgi:SAM-dependent methyltransferase